MVPGLGRVSGHPIELEDGTILLPFYLRYAGDAGGFRAELLASSDGGRSFQRRASIATPPANVQYPEPDVVELPDGDLYAVFRHHEGSTLAPLLWARSSDQGHTWSAPAAVMIASAGAAPAPRTGVNPQLALLPSGVVVLSSGRPDNFVAISTDPDRVTWTAATTTYVNHPSATSASYGAGILRIHGSSGNTGLVVLDADRVIQLGDNCANGWGCPPADSGYTIDGKNRVWGRIIEVATPDVGKIDLASKVERGLVQVSTDMNWTSDAHPRARPAGAFDGSTDYWSSAVTDRAGGTLTLHLDQRYDSTRVGLSIRHDAAASASVYASTDGTRWREIVRADRRTHRAIEYTVLPAPVPASYVKVVLGGAGADACDPELGAHCAFLNELELFSTVDSFENDPVGAPPRGYSQAVGALVTGGLTSRRALLLDDRSDSAQARVVWTGAARSRKRLEFTVKPLALPGGFLFDVLGTDASGATVNAFHLALMPDGSLDRYDVAAARWEPLTGAGVIAVGETARIEVDAGIDGAAIRVNGEEVATAAPSAPGAIALDGHVFASSGTRPVGDQVLIDDVYSQ